MASATRYRKGWQRTKTGLYTPCASRLRGRERTAFWKPRYTSLVRGALAIWLMDEASTGPRLDYLGGPSWDSVNDVGYVAGKFGNAAEPDDVAFEQSLTIPDDGHLLGSHTWPVTSFAGWSKIDDKTATGPGNTTYIIARDNGTQRDWQLGYNRFANCLIVYGLWNGSFVNANSVQDVTEGEWFSWAVQIDKTEKKLRCRIDGNAWGAWSTAGNATVETAAPLRIFARGDVAEHSIHTQDFIIIRAGEFTEAEYQTHIYNAGNGPSSGNPTLV